MRTNMDPSRKGLMTLLGCLVTLVLPQKFVSRVGATGSPPVREYNISGILNSLQVGYDKRVRPNYGGPPVSVEISMLILSISSLSEVQMDFTLDFYFRQYWKDPRMEFPHQPGIEVLSVSTDYLQHIWVPDTFFANEKTSYFHMATTSNEFLRIKYDGQIQRSIRLTITATCPMNLKFFPMDRQLCAVEIESFGGSLKDIVYKWIDSPKAVAVEPEVELPQFKIMGFRKTSRVITTSTGNYSRLACQIQFVRSMGYYLIQIYIPSSLIVVISWVSFWLNRTASPARVSLGVTTVLTMTTLMSSTNAALPKISYIKSIDIFLGTCFVMVFASLLEYATVGYLAKRIEMKKKHYQNLQKLVEQHRAAMAETEASSSTGARGGERGKSGGLDEEAALALLAPHAKNLNQMYGITPSDIDKYSRVCFPVFFTCFHLVYWNVYLHISDVVADDLIPHVV